MAGNGKRQQLQTEIVLTGKIENSAKKLSAWLDTVGNKAISLGGQYMKLGEKLLETTKLYADFDDAMRATQGKLVTATAQDMEKLEKQVRSWAETTRFGAVETANAVKEAASSGWELTEIYEGIPTVMTLAATAGMNLTDATEYLNSALAGLNMDMSESTTLVDQWVMASNRSRASVQDMGEAMQRLGSLMTFTESSDEVLTLLSVMAEYGTKGAEAGTLLRNVMLRLIAPTAKAAETLDMLDASEEELAELGEMNLGAASEAMDALGLSVFDAEGNLKSMIQVISELRRATSGMTEEEMYPMLAAIFPTRTLRGIMDLLRTSDEEYASIQNRIRSSGGYASEIAALQEGGIGGSIRNLRSAFEELKLTVGEAMNPQIIKVTDALTELIRNISDMPEGTWDFIGNIFATIVKAGPVLIGVGTTLKLASMLLTPTGAIAGTVTMIISLLTLFDQHVEERRKKNFENLFGSATLDVAEMRKEMDKSTGAITAQSEALDALKGDVQTNLTEVAALYEQLTGKLTQYTITGQELTKEQQDGLIALGQNLSDKVKEGIEQGELYHLNMLDALFGNDTDDPTYRKAFSASVLTSSQYYDSLKSEYEQLGTDLFDQIKKGIETGDFSGAEEVAKKMIEYEAEVARMVADADAEAALYKAGRVDMDSLGQFLTENKTAEEEQIAAMKENIASQYGADAAAINALLEDADTEAERQRLLQQKKDIEAGYSKKEEEETARIHEVRAGANMTAVDSAFEKAGLGDAWELVKRINEQGVALEQGGLNGDYVGMAKTDWEKALNGMQLNQGEELLTELNKANVAKDGALSEMLESLGDKNLDQIMKTLDEYAGTLKGMQIEKELRNFAPNLAENMRTWINARFGSEELQTQTTPDIADDEELQKQATNDAQTYVSQAQAELDKNPVKLHVNMVPGKSYSINYDGYSYRGSGSGSQSGTVKNAVSKLFSNLFYADGGRADTASIFGEAGPEWAIPEKHTARTASLLEAAAKASGFGSMGLTAGGSSSGPATIVYSPVINAQDARGVDGALKEDKKRLEKWWNERAARAEAEAFG
uniref:Minor tail protein n=1 Tax=Caudovirales sp. ctrNG92 TaxID=2827638 RepID=A0A8S5SDQ9_9CAUD|nr:MAG TPA: minor tail protein [Caudovirales sp. ctrNG92]